MSRATTKTTEKKLFDIDMNTEVFHYGETLTIAELEKKTEDKEQFQRWLNKITLEIVSERLNQRFGSDIEDYYWSGFLGVPYYEHIEWGLRDDDCSDQYWFLKDLIENIPNEIISKLIQLWEKSDHYPKAIEDINRLKDNIRNSFEFLKHFQENDIYLPELIQNTLTTTTIN